MRKTYEDLLEPRWKFRYEAKMQKLGIEKLVELASDFDPKNVDLKIYIEIKDWWEDREKDELPEHLKIVFEGIVIDVFKVNWVWMSYGKKERQVHAFISSKGHCSMSQLRGFIFPASKTEYVKFINRKL